MRYQVMDDTGHTINLSATTLQGAKAQARRMQRRREIAPASGMRIIDGGIMICACGPLAREHRERGESLRWRLL